MVQKPVQYDDVRTKNIVENWADEKGVIAAQQIVLHLEERFEVRQVLIRNAIDQGDFLSLQISTDKWSEPREFVLMSNGSLAW